MLSQKKRDIKGGSGFSPLLVYVPVRGAQRGLETDALTMTQFNKMGLTDFSILSRPTFRGKEKINEERPQLTSLMDAVRKFSPTVWELNKRSSSF